MAVDIVEAEAESTTTVNSSPSFHEERTPARTVSPSESSQDDTSSSSAASTTDADLSESDETSSYLPHAYWPRHSPSDPLSSQDKPYTPDESAKDAIVTPNPGSLSEDYEIDEELAEIGREILRAEEIERSRRLSPLPARLPLTPVSEQHSACGHSVTFWVPEQSGKYWATFHKNLDKAFENNDGDQNHTAEQRWMRVEEKLEKNDARYDKLQRDREEAKRLIAGLRVHPRPRTFFDSPDSSSSSESSDSSSSSNRRARCRAHTRADKEDEIAIVCS